MSATNSTQKRLLATTTSPPSKKPKTIALAECDINQPLIDTLEDLADAMVFASSSQPNLRFQAAQIRKVVSALADLETPVTSGTALTSGVDKIKGLGKKTAAYIDDFLKTGSIAAIKEFQNKPSQPSNNKHNKNSKEKNDKTNDQEKNETSQDDDNNSPNIIFINRAPILALWATIVSERQGYTRAEALTHAKWIQVITARAKGKSLGIWGGGGASKGGSGTSSLKQQPTLNVWSRMNVPVESTLAGRQFAVTSVGAIDPAAVERYLRKALGGDYDKIQDAFRRLADSTDPDTLRKQAFDLYSEIRPDWQGWGKPGKMDLNKVEALCA